MIVEMAAPQQRTLPPLPHARRNNGKVFVGQKAIDRQMKQWHPLDTLAISGPSSKRYVLAFFLAEYREQLHHSYSQRVKLNAMLMLLFAAIIYLAAGVARVNNLRQTSYLIAGLGLFIWFDYWTVIRHQNATMERCAFNLQIRKTCRADVIFCSAAMMVVGLSQLIGQEIFGGYENLVKRWGLMYGELFSGAYWRVLTGPFFHDNLIHWGSNFLMLVFIGSIACTVRRRIVLFTFLIGTTSSPLFAAIFHTMKADDAFVGISGGVNAIFGLVAIAAAYKPSYFPAKFSITLTAFIVLNMYLSLVSNAMASTSAHVGGALIGVAIGGLCRKTLLRDNVVQVGEIQIQQ